MTISELKNRLEKSVEFLNSELAQIRTGRANPRLLEDIEVNAYETKMTIKELGSVTLQDSQTILISPWDKGLLESIAKAIRESDLNLSPVEVGSNLKVPLPPLTEERRKELARVVSQKVEECKLSLRSIRQDAMKDIDQEFSEKLLSEDEKFSSKEEVEKVVKEMTEMVDQIGEGKNSELLTV